MGNLVEAYDVSICYFLFHELSSHFLGDDTGAPWVVLSLIFIAYLAKPIGAFILGLASDLYGRKQALMASIIVMGISTALTGLIPDFSRIGLWAAFLFLILRIVQSMALGSEFLNSASFLVESGDDSQRGFRGCWSSVGVKTGALLACLIASGTHAIIIKNPDLNWVWRIPFLLSILTTLVGIAIRYRMPESLGYIIHYASREKPTTHSIYQESLLFIKKYPFLFNYAFFASFLSVTTGFFFYLYIPLHAASQSHFSTYFITSSAVASLVLVSLLIPIFGWISDKYDRLKMLTFASSGLFALAYPFMIAINSGHTDYYLMMQLLISVPCACYYSVSSVILTELFPIPIRCTVLSLIFSIAASIASGAPPLLAEYLSNKTDMPNSPCVIIIFLAGIALINIKILATRYRCGKNTYNSMQILNSDPLFDIQYQLKSTG